MATAKKKTSKKKTTTRKPKPKLEDGVVVFEPCSYSSNDYEVYYYKSTKELEENIRNCEIDWSDKHRVFDFFGNELIMSVTYVKEPVVKTHVTEAKVAGKKAK